MTVRRSWALVTLDENGQPAAVLMILDEQAEAEEIAFALGRSGTKVFVVPYGPDQNRDPQIQVTEPETCDAFD